MNELKYIIRLDDVSERMNIANWVRMEALLDKYNIKPIIGIIPESTDPNFNWDYIDDYSEIVKEYQNKGYIIAQHGYHHDVRNSAQSEFAGKTVDEQKEIIKAGFLKLKSMGINPTCFYAPKHSFDKNTIRAIRELNYFNFVSDGYAFFPFKFDNVQFLPSLFNTAKKILPFGIYTFVYHPNTMKEEDFQKLERFISSTSLDLFFVDYVRVFNKVKTKRKYYGLIYLVINMLRKMRVFFYCKGA